MNVKLTTTKVTLAALSIFAVSAGLPALTHAQPKAQTKAATKIQAKSQPKAQKVKVTIKAPPKAKANKPAQFVSARAQKVLTTLKSRPLRINDQPSSQQDIAAGASKQSWLSAIYSKNMIEASWATQMLADKRILAEILDRELGQDARLFYPKTLGLREFLTKHQLTNAKGVITATGEQIDEALFSEFPAGFVVRPAVGVAPQERGHGLYADSDEFVVDLLKEGSPLYSPSHKRAVKSHILDTIASGEAIVLQEDVMRVADAKKRLKNQFFHEVRVHTYENKVIEGAVPARWVQTNLLTPEQIHRAEQRVGEMLKSLPMEFLNRQAWGVDVAVMDNGEMRVIDVVTNRGKEIPWSGYLDQPRVIGAYSRHFEMNYGMKFQGWSGTLIRNNFANYMPFWEKRIEKAKPGWNKAVALLPPLP